VQTAEPEFFRPVTLGTSSATLGTSPGQSLDKACTMAQSGRGVDTVMSSKDLPRLMLRRGRHPRAGHGLWRRQGTDTRSGSRCGTCAGTAQEFTGSAEGHAATPGHCRHAGVHGRARGWLHSLPCRSAGARTSAEKGFAAASAQYKELKTKYFGAQAYDFSETGLIATAQPLIQTRTDEAIQFLQMNLELFPGLPRAMSRSPRSRM
jgi:hypothetical protein